MPRLSRNFIGLLACLLLAVGIAAPAASADRAFSPRYSTNDQGDITMAANTLMTCPSSVSTCAASQAGTNTLSNGDYTMGYVDVDSDANTFNSSQANLAVPAGSTVLFAGLYWAADTSSSLRNKGAPNPALANTVKFSRPGLVGYSNITASQFDTSAAASTNFQGFADVTSAVQAGGSGTYGVANVQPARTPTATPAGRSSWSTAT